MTSRQITIQVKLDVLPHLPSDDAVHAEECVHVRTSFPGSSLKPCEEWMCIEWCPLRRSLECAGAVYVRPEDEATELYARLRSGEPI